MKVFAEQIEKAYKNNTGKDTAIYFVKITNGTSK